MNTAPAPRETLGSRLGFLLLSAGCAIGIGNVWRFPWLAGQYGGACFVLVYLLCLALLGLPVLVMEFAMGRAARRSPVLLYQALGHPGWRWHGALSLLGNLLLMMYYTTVAGWMLTYFAFSAAGAFAGLDAAAVGAKFSATLASPALQVAPMALVVAAGFAVCAAGLRGGLERVTKWLMLALLALMALLAAHSVLPACFAFGVEPGAGPGLLFVTLPNVFASMAAGRLWGSLFFVFMSFAAFSTVLAVFENILACVRDLTGWTRRRAAPVCALALFLLSLPCALGWSLLAGFRPLGPGSGVLDLEDFLVSNLILPGGALVYALFCCHRFGWGWDAFSAEANTGRGLRLPRLLRPWCACILPLLILAILLLGLWNVFAA